jgi:hypothetical protein
LQKNKTTSDSAISGYYCKPTDTAGFYRYYQALSIMIKRVLDQKLIGIYLCENLAVGGFLLTACRPFEQYFYRYETYLIIFHRK